MVEQQELRRVVLGIREVAAAVRLLTLTVAMMTGVIMVGVWGLGRVMPAPQGMPTAAVTLTPPHLLVLEPQVPRTQEDTGNRNLSCAI